MSESKLVMIQSAAAASALADWMIGIASSASVETEDLLLLSK